MKILMENLLFISCTRQKTSKFVDAFYKVRDRIESFTDIDLTHSLLYKKRHDGKSLRDISVEFDWNKMEARYIDNINKEKEIASCSNQ